MLSTFTDVAPKSVVAAALLWAGVSYFGTGPEIASRVARADFLPICEANFRDVAMKAGEERLKSLPLPSIDPAQEYAAKQIRRFQNNPFMDQLRGMTGGMGDVFGIDEAANTALQQMQAAKRSAKQAYETSLAKIKQETATSLGAAGSICGCVADAAIAETRTEWAIYAGTLTLIAPAPVKNFSEKMAQVHRAGGCAFEKAGS